MNPFIRNPKQIVNGFGGCFADGKSDSKGCLGWKTAFFESASKFFANASGHDVYVPGAGLYKHRSKFIVPVPGDEIGSTRRLRENVRYSPQHFVAGLVAILIVDRPQLKDIDQCQQNAAAASPRSCGDSSIEFMECPPVRKTG
jgi:hypothetical protein